MFEHKVCFHKKKANLTFKRMSKLFVSANKAPANKQGLHDVSLCQKSVHLTGQFYMLAVSNTLT